MIRNIFSNYNVNQTKSSPFITEKNSMDYAYNLKADKFIRSQSSTTSSVKTANISSPRSLSFGAAQPVDVVLKKLNSQVMDVLDSEIQGIVNDYHPNEQNKVLKILNKATQFGNIDSFNNLYDEIVKKGRIILSFNDNHLNSLSENFTYLFKKKAFPANPSAPITTEGIMDLKKGAFLLDDNIISRIKDNPELKKHIQETDFKLYYPEGWDDGITTLNLTTIEDIKSRTDNLFKMVKNYESQGLNEDEAISKALRTHAESQLESLGLQDKLEVLSNGNLKTSETATASDVAKQLESKKMTTQELEESLRDNYTRDAALDILYNDARIVSMRELGLIAKKTNSEILNIAKEKGIPEDKIYYIIPQLDKSYGFIASQYQQVNKIPEKQFINTFSNIPKDETNALFVVLDDYAGSGQSLDEALQSLRKVYKGEVVIAPSVATQNAMMRLNRIAKADGNTSIVNGEKLNSYFNSNEYNKIRSKFAYNALIGKGGWGAQADIVFPYMSPDNNIPYFADNIAKHYTLNAAGVRPAQVQSSSDTLD